MVDVVISPVTKPIVIGFGESASEAGRQAARAAAAADAAQMTVIGARVYDEVIAATAQVAGLTVTISGGQIARLDTIVPFAGSITLDAPATTTVANAAYTLSYVNGQAFWAYLPTRLPGGNLTNLVVKDAATSAILMVGTDYIVDPRLGGLALAQAGQPRNVLVSYTSSRERYDLICVDPEFQSLYAVQGQPGVRDASERMPDIGTKAAGQTLIPMRLPLFYARVTASSVELVKVWNIRGGVAREYEPQFLADQRRNREALAPFLAMIRSGAPTIWSAQGDSITAIQSEEPSKTVPNGRYRDVATVAGSTYTYLREGIISADLIDAIRHDYDNGDTAGATHTRFGRMWDLVNAASARFAGAVTYRNYSIAGTSSDDAPLGMTEPSRLAAWAQDGSDLKIILTGMNEFLVGVTTLFNRVRSMIDAAHAADSTKGVIVWGCSRPAQITGRDPDFLRVNRVLRQAAVTPGPTGRTAAFIDPTFVSYGDGAGTMGVVPSDFCIANGGNHPGIRQHRIEGELARKLIFGLT